jgi:hypothetical protein
LEVKPSCVRNPVELFFMAVVKLTHQKILVITKQIPTKRVISMSLEEIKNALDQARYLVSKNEADASLAILDLAEYGLGWHKHQRDFFHNCFIEDPYYYSEQSILAGVVTFDFEMRGDHRFTAI